MDDLDYMQTLQKRNHFDNTFRLVVSGVVIFMFFILAWLLLGLIEDSIGWFNLDFILNFPSRFPHKAGIYPGLIGSMMMMVIVAILAITIGVGSAVYLEEYSNKHGLFYKVIDISISNLSGVPSIIYGILGLSIFSYLTFLKESLLSGAIVITLLVLPVIIVSSQEALKTVPSSLKEAAYGLGMDRWQVIKAVTLPYALPGILTGIILTLSRAIGQGAPLIVVGAATIITNIPSGLTSSYTVLPIQIYYWISQPNEQFQNVAAAGSILLLIILFLMNFAAIVIRNKYQRKM